MGTLSGSDADPAATARAIQAALPRDIVVWVRDAAAIHRDYVTDRRRDFWVFDVILVMIACLAGVGLLNSLLIAVLERRREIGLLRTIGLTARQVGRLLLLESLAVGLIGGLLAMLLAVPLSHLALDGVRIISRLDLYPESGPAQYLLPLGTALALSLLAGTCRGSRARAGTGPVAAMITAWRG